MIRLRFNALYLASLVMISLIPSRIAHAASDLAVGGQVDFPRVTVNQLATIRIAVTNLGPGQAAGVILTNQLPASAGVFSATISQGQISTNGARLVFAFGAVPVGQSVSASLTLHSSTMGRLTNVAWLNSSVSDPVLSNNAATNIVTVLSGTFLSGGQMVVPRSGHTATLLTNGLVLVTGGVNSNGSIASVELFNPATGSSTLVGDMLTPRNNHTATLLPNGKVLIAGHSYWDGMRLWTELYDPIANTLTQTGDLNVPRTQHAASLLPDGRVLATGGIPADASTAEVYDYQTGTWTLLPNYPATLISHTSTVLTNGQILLAGGWAIPPPPALLFVPPSNSFVLTESAVQCRENHTATVLPDGRVLIAGGGYGSGYPTVHASADFFNAATAQFSDAGRMVDARATHTASLLTNGTVLLVGGTLNQVAVTTEIFDPVSGSFTPAASLQQPRLRHTATTLPDGRILILGGEAGPDYYGVYQSSAEVYDASQVQPMPALIIHDVAANEDAPGALAFPVSLSAPMAVPVTVHYSLSIGSAWFEEDFVPTNGVLTIPPGSTNESILIPLLADNKYEADEIIFVTISNAVNAVIARTRATGTIINDDPQPNVSVVPTSVIESNLLTAALIFPVVLSNPSDQTVTVNYSTTNGTATAPLDYLATNGLLTFGPGVTTQYAVVTVLGDVAVESAETVGLSLSNPTNAAVAGDAWGTILNDDGLPNGIHHFELSATSSPQHHSVPFQMTVTAQDLLGASVSSNRPLFLRSLMTNAPPLLFNLEADATSDWRGTNFSYLHGYYELRPYDVPGHGILSQSMRIVPSYGKNGGVAREIELVGGVKYSVRFDAAQANEIATFNDNRFDYTLKIGSTVVAYLPLDQLGRLPPGQVDRRAISGEFTPPTNGIYTLQLLVDTSFPASHSAVYIDNLRIETPLLTPALIFLTNGLWSGPMTLAGVSTDLVLQAMDVEGHSGESNPFNLDPHANLSASCVRNTATPRSFDLCSFSLSVFNSGPSAANQVSLTNLLPSGFTFVSSTSSQLVVANHGTAVVYSMPLLAAGATATASLNARCGPVSMVTNYTFATSTVYDGNLTNNSSSVSFAVSPPRLSVTSTTVTEAPGGTNAVITLALSSSNNVVVSVQLQTTNGSASAGQDYLGTNFTAEIPPGILTQQVSIAVIDDLDDEPNETFVVLLQNFSGAVAGSPASSTVTILDDDLPTLSYQTVGENLQFNWAGNYLLQSNHVLQSGGWVTLTNQPPVLINKKSSPAAFFRLFQNQ